VKQIQTVLKKIGFAFLLLFFGYLFLQSLWNLRIPVFGSAAETVGADAMAIAIMGFSGVGVRALWKRLLAKS
jgi:hypothetical protein